MSSLGRIPQAAMKGMAGTIFSIAFLAAISRTTVQIKRRRPLSVDDAFFAFACVCLCASTALLFLLIGALYFEQKLVLDPNSVSLTTAFQIIPELLGTQRLSYAHLTLTWTVIFSVKFSFMFFFKNLIKRVKNLNIYWRVVVWINAVSYFLCISDVFISCPHITLAGAQCWNDPHNRKPFILTTTVISLDILTDILIIAIPVCLLWAVRIKPSQKLRLGLSLCLGIFMIMTAIVKMTGLRSTKGTFDMAWVMFWHYAEACIAILMVSLTAFRSLFVSPTLSPPRQTPPSWSAKLRLHRARRDQDLQWTNLPTIPPPTLTGMRTFIGRSSGLPVEVDETLSVHESRISVTRVFSVKSEHV